MSEQNSTPGAGDPDVPDPSTWATGGDAPTEGQERYLAALARQTGEEVPDDLNKSEASEKIDRWAAFRVRRSTEYAMTALNLPERMSARSRESSSARSGSACSLTSSRLGR